MKRPFRLILFLCACLVLIDALFIAAAENTTPSTGRSTGNDSIYCGEYLLPSGAHVSVFKTGIITEMARLAFINWENGRTGALERDSLDSFWAAPSPIHADGKQTVLRFGREMDGSIGHLTIKEESDPEVWAPRTVTFIEKPVTFANGDVVLSGTLKIPAAQGPFPAVVLVHGSGPGAREQLESMARFFVQLGMAVLTYDKRGCGASGGDWKTVDLEVLADDALAGISLLASDPAIAPGKIGLWGISQGGWITPLAAARSASVAFVINHSGPGTSLRRQDTFMMKNILGAQGVSAGDIDLVIAGLNTVYDYGRQKTSAEEVDAAIDRIRGKPGLEEFAALSSRNLNPDSLYAGQAIGDPAWFYHLDPDRDALEPYRRLRCPMLVVYGKLDYTVPVEESEERISEVLRESGHPDYQVTVLDRTGHAWTVMQADQPQQPTEPMVVAAEYFTLLRNWLSHRGLCSSPAVKN